MTRFHWTFDGVPLAPNGAADGSSMGTGTGTGTGIGTRRVEVLMLLVSDDAPQWFTEVAPAGWPFARKANVTNHWLPPPPRDQHLPRGLRVVQGKI